MSIEKAYSQGDVGFERKALTEYTIRSTISPGVSKATLSLLRFFRSSLAALGLRALGKSS